MKFEVEPVKKEIEQIQGIEEVSSPDSYFEKYEKEIKPLFEMLKPDDADFSEFEDSMKDLLLTDLKEQQIVRGDLIVSPEENLDQMKDLLNSRLKQALEDNRDYEKRKDLDPEFIKNAKIALIYQEDSEDLMNNKVLEYGNSFDSVEKVKVDYLKSYLLGGAKEKLSYSDLEKLLKTRYRKNLSNISYFDYYQNYTEDIPERLVVDMLEEKDLTNAFHYILQDSENGKYSKDVFSKIMEKGLTKNAFSFIDKFEEIDFDLLSQTEEYNNVHELDSIGEYINESQLEISQKNIFLDRLLERVVELGEGKDSFRTSFSAEYIDYLTKQEKFSPTLEQFIVNTFCSEYASYDELYFSAGQIKIPEDVSLSLRERAFKQVVADNKYGIHNLEKISNNFLSIKRDEETSQLIEDSINSCLSDVESAEKGVYLISNFGGRLPERSKDLEMFREKLEKSIIENLKRDSVEHYLKVCDDLYFFKIKENLFKDKEIPALFEKNLISLLEKGDISKFIDFTEEIELDEYIDLLNQKENIVLIQNNLMSLLEKGDLENFHLFIKPLNSITNLDGFLSDPVTISLIRSKLVDLISPGQINTYFELEKKLNFIDLEGFLDRPDVIGHIKKMFNKIISQNNLKSLIDFQKNFSHKDIADFLVSPEVVSFIREKLFSLILEDSKVSQATFLIKEIDFLSFEDIFPDTQESKKFLEKGLLTAVGQINFPAIDFFKENTSINFTEIKDDLLSSTEEALLGLLGRKKNLSDFQKLIKLMDFTGYKSRVFDVGYDVFGTDLDIDLFNEIKNILEGVEIGDDFKKLGVKSLENDGVRELKSIILELKNSFTKNSFNPEILLDDPIRLSIFKSYTGFSDSGWGNTGNESLKKIIRKSLETAEQEVPFPESDVVYIDKLGSKNKEEKNTYSPDFLERFNVLLDDVEGSKKILLEQDKPLSHITENIFEKIKPIKLRLKEKLLETGNEFAQKNLKEKINLLENINIRSIKDFQDNFKILSQFKEFDSDLRQAMFTFAFAKNRNYLDREISEVEKENPSIEEVSWLVDFVDHITNREVMSQYFTDKQSMRAFEKNINPKALILELSKLQKDNSTDGKNSFKFIPSRNLLTEISGHIGSACWANKYESIVEELPNISSVTMVMNPDNKFERIAGSSVLIETKSTEGDDLLIIRGLNPQENIINQLSIDDFFEQFTKYMKGVAERSGKRLAISIDDHSGGHTTNRPTLFNNIYARRDSLERVGLLNPREANFNGYDISNEVYLID